jgi:hypothetical protein
MTALWTYLLVYNDEFGTLEEVRAFINSRPEIVNWFYCMPNSYFLVSGLTATYLAEVFRRHSGGKGRFILVDTATDRDGWLPQQAWDLMMKPQPVQKR